MKKTGAQRVLHLVTTVTMKDGMKSKQHILLFDSNLLDYAPFLSDELYWLSDHL